MLFKETHAKFVLRQFIVQGGRAKHHLGLGLHHHARCAHAHIAHPHFLGTRVHESAITHLDLAQLVLRIHASIGAGQGQLGVAVGGCRCGQTIVGLHSLVRQTAGIPGIFDRVWVGFRTEFLHVCVGK